ncbi:MAG: DUF1737 domain-containing protein [Rhodobacteraceae bacterium]|nr:DUF1737 domain-containing protein [Paracoccaceae bacterium]
MAQGWVLHGRQAYFFDSAHRVMRYDQAITKEVPDYHSPNLKLREQ